MSKKIIETEEEKSIKEFDKYFKSGQEKEHEEMRKLYNHIRESYKLEFKDDEMKIKIEKMNLERNIGKYQGALRKSNLNLLIGMFGIMLQLVLPEFLKAIGIDKPILSLIFMMAIIVGVIYNMAKDSDKQRPRDLMQFVALKVLDDMEKEVKEKKIRPMNNSSFDEVATTINNDRDEEKFDARVKGNKGIKGLINIISITNIERKK